MGTRGIFDYFTYLWLELIICFVMMFIRWNVEPVAFKVLGVPIMYYSLLFIAGTVLSVWILKRVYERNGMPWEHLQVLVVLSLVGLFLGARIGHCLIYEYDYYWKHPLEIFLPVRELPGGGYVFSGYEGMASHGGALGWIVALVIYSRVTGEKIIRTLDAIALVLPLAACFIRLGNLVNSEIVGSGTSVPWAFVFERVDGVPRHPAQLYEAMAYLAIFGGNMLLYRRVGLRRYPGMLWGGMLVTVFSARFLLEFLKERQVSFEEQMSLDLGQVLSIPFIFAGMLFLLFAWRVSRGNG